MDPLKNTLNPNLIPTLSAIKTPIYILERAKLEKNLKILDNVQQSTGAKRFCLLAKL